MNYQQLIDQITPEIYENLKRAVELGKWPDGRSVSDEQREYCIQGIVAWEARHKPEQERSGYMPSKEVQKADQARRLQSVDAMEQPLSWRE